MHSQKTMPVYCRLIIILSAVFLVFTDKAWSQASISGPSCVLPGDSYGPYTINGASWWNSNDKWCVTGGTINSTGNSCVNNIGAPSIGITWNTGITTGTIAYYSPATASTPIAKLTVSVVNPGSISPSVIYVPNGLPATVTLTASGASGCSGTFSYQWLVSSDNGSSWSDLSGVKGLSYTVTATYTTNYQYRIAVTNSNMGGYAYSNRAVVVAMPPITTGIVSPSSAFINFNTSPGALTATASSGGVCSGNYSYQWQSSVDNSTWTNISGATGLSFSPGNLTTTTYFRQAVTNCLPQTQYTNTATVTVYPPLNVGTATPSSQNVLINSAPAPLSLSGLSGGSGTYTYQWQQSFDNINWNNISGAINATYSAGTLASTGTTYYRAIVTSNGVNATSAAATITALPQLSAGTITGPAGPVAYNTSLGLGSGQNAANGNCNGSYTYQWQQSGDNTTWSNIAGATGSSYSPANLVLPIYYFRRQVSCGTETVYSNTLTITVTPQLFSGTITPDNVVIAAGTSPGELTTNPASGGSCSNYNYQWQQSTNGITWNSISGATGQNYTPGALGSTTWFRREVSCGASVAYTNISTVTVGSSANCDLNYIRERDFFQAGISDKAVADAISDPFSMRQSTQYFDGLGRPVQTVIKQASPGLKDMVSLNMYDGFGRETNKYLPYVSNAADGGYRCTALSEQKTFYTALFPDEKYYYGQIDYEPSPLNRVAKTYAAGTNWIGSSRSISTQYLTNTDVDQVRIWMVNDNTDELGSYSTVQGSAGIYPAGSLFKTITVDEKNNQVIEFKDKEGNVVLKKVQSTASADAGNGSGYAGWLCTYYIYDDLNNLRCVVQPHGVELLTQNMWDISALNGVILDEQCFRYAYDQRLRMIIKKVPGAKQVDMVYDARDRLVMIRDGNLKNVGKWMVTEYDDLNRAIRTGLLTDGSERSTHQTNAYSSTSYPGAAAGYEVLTQTYYDDYNWVAGTGLSATMDNTYTGNSTYFISGYNASPVYAQPLTPSYMARGLATGTKIKILGSANQYLYNISFYDDRGRLIQTQTINVTGGKDILTTQYDFSGKALRTLLQHQKNGANAQTHLVLTKMNYDHAGRLLTVTKTINSTINGQQVSKPEQTIATNTYNELGQLSNKVDGSAIESLAYDYNIRGWLLGINRSFVNDAATNYFGFDLGYDKQTSAVNGAGYVMPQYNGNISGTIWKSKGDNEKRKYDFTYDNVNRLMSADFNQQFGSSWAKTDPGNAGNRMDFSVSNLAYDANGNILTMRQQGWKPGGSTLTDDLTYAYNNGGNSNKLLAVTEGPAIGNIDNKLGDFTDKNTTLDDYTYDDNGNLTTDKNKKVTSIAYNHLNLPAIITANKDDNTLKGTITYTYDAAGNKLKKTVTDNVSGITTTTLYVAGFEYKNDTLQQLGHEEGRIRYAKKYFYNGDSTYDFFYDYFLKDHLGNTRMVLTGQKDTTGYFATMELGSGNSIRNKENQLFSNIDVSSYLAANVPGGYPVDNSVTNPNLYVAKVNASGQKTGPSIVLKVMSGDVIDLAVKSFYRSQGSAGPNSNGLTDILSSLATGMVTVSGGTKGTLAQLSDNTTSPLLGGLNLFRSTNNSDPVGKPKAYLNWILLDERFNYVSSYPQSGALPVGNADALQTLAYSGINITKSGYLYIYVSNETQNWDVFFDNLAIKHYTGPILEETHYYPFGLTMAGISSKALNFGVPENKHKFNGIEQNNDFDLNMYDAFYRNLDPQIGRFWQTDPKPNEVLSPYSAMGNNPIILNDPLGDTTFYYGANGQYYGRVLNKGSETVVVVDEKYDERFQAYHDNNFKDFEGRKADDLVKEFGQYGVTYDAAAMSKYYDDNNGTTKAEKVDGTKIDDMKNPTFNDKSVSKQFLKSLNAEMLGNLVLKDGKVTVGTGRHSDNDLVKNSPGSLPYEEGKVAHIHNHPPMKPFRIAWEVGAFNATSGVSGSPGAGPSSADYSQSSGNTTYRNVVVDQKNIYFINGSQTVKHPR